MVYLLSHVATALVTASSTWLILQPDYALRMSPFHTDDPDDDEPVVVQAVEARSQKEAGKHAKCKARVAWIKAHLYLPVLKKAFMAYIRGCQTYIDLNVCGALRNFALVIMFSLWQLMQIFCYALIVMYLLKTYASSACRKPISDPSKVALSASVQRGRRSSRGSWSGPSGSLQEEDSEPDKRKAFSPWRCLVQTKKALNSERSQPYAVLELRIVRARGLLPLDLNGKSDPYVSLEMNGISLHKRTSVKYATLAPHWDDSFHIEVYQPQSVCRLDLYDKDTVKNAFGYFGDFMGFVDLNIGVLPHNKKVIGWVPVQPPTKNDPSCDNAGEIYLELTLNTGCAEHEFFALLMGPPDIELPPLDIPRVKHLFGHLQKQTFPPMIKLFSGIGDLWVSSGPIAWFGLIVLVWHPKGLLPAVFIILGILIVSLVLLDLRGAGVFSGLSNASDANVQDTKLEMLQSLLPEKAENILRKIQYWFDKVIFILIKVRCYVVHKHLFGWIGSCVFFAAAYLLGVIISQEQLTLFQIVVSVIIFYFGLLPQTVFFRWLYAMGIHWSHSRLELYNLHELSKKGYHNLQKAFSSTSQGDELVLQARAIHKLTQSLASDVPLSSYQSIHNHHFQALWSHPGAGRCEDCARRLWMRLGRYRCQKCSKVICGHCYDDERCWIGCHYSRETSRDVLDLASEM